MIAALLIACAPGVPNGVTDDVSGDWYGSFAHEGPDPWTVRLFDVRYLGLLEPTIENNRDVTGVWQEWEGTFEMWGSLDVAAVRPWFEDPEGVPTEDLVADFSLWICEDVIRCTYADDVYAPHWYLLTARPDGAEMIHAGTFDPAELNPMWGEAWWIDAAGNTLTGGVALAPAYRGLRLGDPP